MLVTSSACGSGDTDVATSNSSGRTAGACVSQFEYQGRTYRDVANIDFTVTTALGFATQASCHDTGTETAETSIKRPAYAVKGISPEVAIAVGDSPSSAALHAVYSGPEVPKELQDLVRSK
ncbi:DUF6281 family protein [Streptomyces coeruleoprunus]|uniref:DUF6281 family protein n=1 Tax=Streptomyces coeruleoprunus TaxID=285563 RepID=A0ABV9XQN5_9ACTN